MSLWEILYPNEQEDPSVKNWYEFRVCDKYWRVFLKEKHLMTKSEASQYATSLLFNTPKGHQSDFKIIKEN